MNEPKLCAAVFDALGDEYCAELSADVSEHTFSSGFEMKMTRLIRRRERPYFPLVNTALKRTACITAAVCAALFFSFKGAVYAYEKFSDDLCIIECGGLTTVFSNKALDSPASVTDTYSPSYLPEGFTLDHSNLTEKTFYLNYNNGSRELFFMQYTKNDFLLSDKSELLSFDRIDIGGHSGLIREFEPEDALETWCELYWDNGEYIIAMTSSVGKDELLKAARSVQKDEKYKEL